MIQLVGARPSTYVNAAANSTEAEDLDETTEELKKFEFMLKPEKSRCMSRVQLRGSENPPWFPGNIIKLNLAIKLMNVGIY